jgi:hypothetical protein
VRKDKSGDRYRDRDGNSTFIPRKAAAFEIGPNSNPRKVSRWLGRGGGVKVQRSAEDMAKAHIHPRRYRRFA